MTTFLPNYQLHANRKTPQPPKDLNVSQHFHCEDSVRSRHIRWIGIEAPLLTSLVQMKPGGSMCELGTQVQHEEVTQRSRSLTSFPAQEGQVQVGGGRDEEGGAQDHPTPWKEARNASWLGPYMVGELPGKCRLPRGGHRGRCRCWGGTRSRSVVQREAKGQVCPC